MKIGVVLKVSLLMMMMMAGLGMSQQIQSFLTRPSDTKVSLGDTAVLRCSVSARHGDVQWIHEGTALGYDRKVPGKPRYSVVWNQHEETEYHLTITNVTLEDEGMFSCQVAPIGDWDTKLEAKARLIVLVPPSRSPEIMFNDESKNSFDIVHFRSMSLKSTRFSCTVRRSKPAAIIKWYVNDTLAGLDIGKAIESRQQNAELEDVTSVFELKQQTNQIYNNSVIKCQAFHESFGLNAQLSNMSRSLRIVVVYPPSVPVITGYDPSVGVAAGSELKLVCSSTYTYPPAMLTWYRDGKMVSKNYDTIQSMKTTEAIYRIANVSPTDNKAFFKCESINQAMDEPFASNVTINVVFGPDKLTMNGVFEVEIGKPISAVCFTEIANPAPTLRFNFDGVDYEPNSLTSSPVASPATKGAFLVNASFSQVVKYEHNNKELKCYAENKLANIKQVVTKQIKVLYPPDTLDITHTAENRPLLNEGTRVRIICVSRGGNPLPEIQWLLDSTVKLTATTTQSIVYTVESVLDITLQREHHQKPIECRSVNKAGMIKQQVVFNVSYLPSDVVMSLVEPKIFSNQITNLTVNAGNQVVFACRAANSNPEPIITWFKDSYPILVNSAEQLNVSTQLINNNKEYDTISYLSFPVTSSDHMKEVRCDVKVRDIPRTMHGALMMEVKFAPELIKYPASIIDVFENASFSLNLSARANPAPTYKCSASNRKIYTVVNSTLSFIATRNDNSEFSCTIANTENKTDVNFRLNVKYSPSARINSTVHVTTKGNQIQLFCILDGNPILSNHITWKSKDKPFINRDNEQYYSVKFLPPNLSVLTISNARDVDDGNISCTIANGVGRPEVAYTELRVKRSPELNVDTSVLKAGQDSNLGHSAMFKCAVVAFPDATFKWKLPTNIDIQNSTKYVITNEKRADLQMQMSTLIVYSVMSSDYGTYVCEARNEIGSTLAKAVLSGKHQPEQPSEFRVINITKNSISLAWKKNFDGGDAQKFRVRFRKDTMDPTYKYVETENDVTSMTLDGLETATRYVINIQSLNRFGTEGFLREPLIVQTDFGFNEVNQMPIFTGNDFPLTVILVICGSGTLFMLFNVAFIIYLIKKRKRKGEADSTTDTNETEANTVEMFSPPPPYPEELNYQIDLNGNNFEDENKPFVPQFGMSHSQMPSKYLNYLNDQLDYAIEYATPIHQNWPTEQSNDIEDDIYLSSLRQLDKNLSSAGGVLKPSSTVNSTMRSSFAVNQQQQHQQNNRLSFVNRPIATSSSFNQNLNNFVTTSGAAMATTSSTSSPYAPGTITDNYLIETRAFPYDPLNQHIQKRAVHQPSLAPHMINYPRTNSSCKIYQDLDEYKGHLDDLKSHGTEFKGHLV